LKNEYKITKRLVQSWTREWIVSGVSDVILTVLWALVGLMGIFMIVILSLHGGDWLNWYLAVLFVLLSVFKLFFSRYITWMRRYGMMAKLYGTSEWLRTTEFNADAILLTEQGSTTAFRYESIKKIKEKKNVAFVIFQNGMGLRLYKDAFTEGSWESCKQLLLEKSRRK